MIQNLRHIQLGIAIGNEMMLGELYKLFHKRLQHFSKAIIRSDELAEEVVNDVFVKLWSRREKINNIDNLTVYLYIAVKNQSLNALSKKAQELITQSFGYLDIELENETCSADELMITKEMMQRMQKSIEALPPRCKMIFKLVREDGLKYKEVGQILNISVNTIDVQMAIAVKRICTALQLEKSKKSPYPAFLQKKL